MQIELTFGPSRPEITSGVTRGAARLFAHLGYAPLFEVSLPNARRADVMALGPRGEIAIVEVKSGREDFAADRKWGDYLDWCDRFFFAVAPEFPTLGAIGTPACAAETLLACLVRADEALCRAVNAPVPARAVDGVAMQLEYVIERVSLIRPENVTEDVRDLDWYKPGYALVEMLRRACADTQPACGEENWDDLQVYLHRREGGGSAGWEVVHWRSDSEPDVVPEVPESFLRRDPPSR